MCVCVCVQCECVQKQEAVQGQITSLRSDVKKLQTEAMTPPPQSLAQAAVHTENFITSVLSHTHITHTHTHTITPYTHSHPLTYT